MGYMKVHVVKGVRITKMKKEVDWMEDCKYVVRGNLCSSSNNCEHRYSFSNKVRVDGIDVYGVCEKASVF